MTQEESIALLHQQGDPLEQIIAFDKEGNLAAILPAYSMIWANHVYRRRLPNSSRNRVDDDWMDFAGSHYTALLRCYFAREALDGLITTCDNANETSATNSILHAHEFMASFWWSMGSAIDNLEHAYRDAPALTSIAAIAKSPHKQSKMLTYIYDRRTQLTHSRVVPIWYENKKLQFHAGYFCTKLDNPNVAMTKYTDWSTTYTAAEVLGNYHNDVWPAFMKAMQDAWEKLGQLLHDCDHPPIAKKVNFPMPSAFEVPSYTDVKNQKKPGEFDPPPRPSG